MKRYFLAVIAGFYFTSTRSQSVKDTLIIHFDYNRSVITSTAASQLDSLLKAVSVNNFTRLDLTGHCDYIGSHAYNDSLSLQRSKAVMEYLQLKGLPADVIKEEAGMGKRYPLTNLTSDAARAMNRRVAITYSHTAVAVTTAKPAQSPIAATQDPTPKSPQPLIRSALSALIRDTATKVGSTLVLPDLNFEPGRHFLMAGSYGILRELYRVMADNPTLQIEIQGHICCLFGGIDGQDIDTGDPDLSVQRAKAIYEYLRTAGIDPGRMKYTGFGSSQKLYPEERTPLEQAKNRRVEIKIISK